MGQYLWHLRPTLKAPAEARELFHDVRGASPSSELLLSELVTNAVRHGQLAEIDSIDVYVEASESSTYVAVLDPGDGFIPHVADDRAGRGLELVRALSTHWGVQRSERGITCVWFEVDRAQ